MKKLLLCCLLASSVWAQTNRNAERGPAVPPNIVLIVGDDHDRSAIGCYGNRDAGPRTAGPRNAGPPQVKTPNLDYLAREGVRFTRAYATTSSCSPSRSTLLSGRHNHNTGQYGLAHATHHFRSHEELKTLPALLHDAGYITARIGKYHVAPESAYPFDKPLGEDGSNPVKMANQCADFLEANREKPFFLYFCPTDPHRAGNGDKLPYKANPHGNKPGGHEGVTETLYGADSLKVPFFLPDAPETRAELAQYYQAVSRMDQGIGRLFDILKEKDLWENTIIIYLSDNGMPVPGAKTTHYEPGVVLPLIVRNPFFNQKGTVCNELVSWVDVAPTILDFAGDAGTAPAGPPERAFRLNPPVMATSARPAGGGEFGERGPTPFFHGKSWKPFFANPAQFKSDTVFLSHTFHEVTMYYPMRSVVTKRYKLIHNIAHGLPFPFAADLWASATWQGFVKSGKKQYGPRSRQAYEQRPAFELYDLEKDPQERTNLAGSKAHKAVFNTLLASMKNFQEMTNDPWRVKWRHE